jgi:hypothetical protein
MRVGDGQGKLGDIVEQALARHDGPPQHGIDQAAHAGFSGFHGFVDRRMFGNAEDQELAKSDPQHVACFRIHLAVAQFADPVVQQPPVAQHAEKDCLQQAAVGGGKHAAVGMAVDQGFGVIVAFRPGTEGGDGGLADVEIFCGHEGGGASVIT